MVKRFIVYLLLILFMVGTTFIIQIFSKTIHTAQVIDPSLQRGYWMSVVLLPLDSRPPCTQFAEQLALIAGIKLILPPPQLLDNYKVAADKYALRHWLRTNIKQADAAIVSVDMLIHGGLLASRHTAGTAQDQEETLTLLKELHLEHPSIPIYAFNIIPRLFIADGQDSARFQKPMAQYSVLKNQVDIFENPIDIQKLSELQTQIPSEIIAHYHTLYKQNSALNVRLMEMVNANILASLVIGQDDGQAFGLPNIAKQYLQTYLARFPGLQDKVFITRGTDEVALTILGNLIMGQTASQPRIYVMYSHLHAPEIVMPFMPNTVRQTVEEKICLTRGIQVHSLQDADIVLYIHIGTRNTKDKILTAAVHELNSLVKQGYKVAVVDLTEDFYASETLLSLLLKEDTDLTKLIAYAGWNTTSNSVGTAVTQAVVFTQALKDARSPSDTVLIYKSNLEFLVARFLDDWYYQKDIQPDINRRLRVAHIDPSSLDTNYRKTDSMIHDLMQSKARHLLNQGLYNRPISIETEVGQRNLVITDLQVETHLPWQRTFELRVQPILSLAWQQE